MADQQQREQALDSSRSFIVQAPAGSGKTSLLIQRYLVLLANVHKIPEEILAITFTRKAASEMRMRIQTALYDASSQPAPVDPHKLKIWQLAKQVLKRDSKSNWNLLDNLNRLNIFTIDGLCHSLVKQMPILSGLGGSFNIVRDSDAQECYRKAVHDLLVSIKDEPPYQKALKNLLLHLDNNYQKIEDLLINMLSRRDQWLPHIMKQQNFETAITNIINENIENCKMSIPSELFKEIISIAESHIPEFYNCSELIKWQKIAKLLLTQEYEWRKTIDKRQNLHSLDKTTKQQILNLIKKLQQYEDIKENLHAILVSPTPEPGTQKQLPINNLIEILKVLAAYLRTVFRERKVVDYIEIALAAQQALGEDDNPTDLLLKLDYRIQHILVDEFQDTSVTQYKLLKQLSAGWQPDDGRTLFLVGDPMQSIYKFREAKVGLFLHAKKYGINSIKLYPLTLSSNFRADKYLIDWTNSVFPKVFPSTENINLGSIPFIPATAVHNNNEQLNVNTHFFPDKDYLSEAQKIIAIIQRHKAVNSYESIAILVRSRSHLEYIIPALQKAGLSYNAVELDSIGERIIVQDLFSLTKALLNLHDRISWLSILRAPWCGLTLADLHVIAKHNHDLPLWHTINKYHELSKLSADGKIRLQNLVAVLSHYLVDLHRENIRELVEKTWLALNGHRCLRNETELNNAEEYFALLSEINVDNLNSLETKIKTLYAKPDSNADDNLQIMTIHKAKGLEFDTVIIPGLNHKLHIDRDPLLMCDERPSTRDIEDTNLILAPIGAAGEAPNPVYEYLRYEDKRKNSYEEGRLLYVAVTRAKKSLYLLGCLDKKPNSGSLLELLSSGLLIGSEKSLVLKDSSPKSKLHTTKLSRLPSNKFMKISLNQEETKANQSYILNTPNNVLKNIGIVIHNCLNTLSKANLNNWLENDLKQQREIWRKQLIQLGTIGNLTKNIHIIEDAIKTTILDPCGQWILNKNHQDAQSEYQTTLIENNEIKHLIIDRTFVDNSTRWIIDYKTSTFNVNDLNIKDFLSNQFQLHRDQLETYARAIHHLDNRPIRLGLYFPMFAGWYEWS
ncbi:MAG: hypothetical protein AMJ43_05950 [Coxiella sp. DG_40]|nr:MAG: hypothetical protein AMJ43_05950 [Coxiella sp. DG_40]